MGGFKVGLAYLATPYSKFPDGIEAAFIAASKLTAQLLRAGIKVYSPIAHTHPVAIHGDIDPHDHAIWMPFDQAMMDVCDSLIVAHLPSWETSKGVAIEIEVFEKAGKPIFDLEPASLSMVKRRKAA
jgi:nucleoside 2-deoxyribosyltransferase